VLRPAATEWPPAAHGLRLRGVADGRTKLPDCVLRPRLSGRAEKVDGPPGAAAGVRLVRDQPLTPGLARRRRPAFGDAAPEGGARNAERRRRGGDGHRFLLQVAVAGGRGVHEALVERYVVWCRTGHGRSIDGGDGPAKGLAGHAA